MEGLELRQEPGREPGGPLLTFSVEKSKTWLATSQSILLPAIRQT